jgi:ComF family protein
VIDFFLPRICLHCSRRCKGYPRQDSHRILSKYLCPDCLARITEQPRPSDEDVRGIMGRFILEIEYQPIAGFEFVPKSHIQSVIHAFKYDGMPRLAKQMGRVLAERIGDDAALREIDCILPVPLHRTRFAERGFNQAEALASGFAEVRGLADPTQGLIKRKHPTRSQTRLSVDERIQNVKGAFTLTREGLRELQGRRVLILDDVTTTGSTLSSVARSVVEAEPKSVAVAALAIATQL